jgi:septal ring factor EnvC (AmiA/AmiB activator)
MQAELATVKDELAVTQQEKHALQLQMVEKERALQATKADLIETRLELQRTESRLAVCFLTQICGRMQAYMRTVTQFRAPLRQLFSLLELYQQPFHSPVRFVHNHTTGSYNASFKSLLCVFEWAIRVS